MNWAISVMAECLWMIIRLHVYLLICGNHQTNNLRVCSPLHICNYHATAPQLVYSKPAYFGV